MMIKPPINDLVKKAGNRYSLVILAAKRARDIAAQEKEAEKDREQSQEPSTLESRLKEKLEGSKNKKRPKPLLCAVQEIAKGEIRLKDPSEPDDYVLEETIIDLDVLEAQEPLQVVDLDEEDEDEDDEIELPEDETEE